MTVPRTRFMSAVVAAALAVVAMSAALPVPCSGRVRGGQSARGHHAHPGARVEQLELLPALDRRCGDRGRGEGDADHGLEADGFQYVNLDDFWYQCPGPQGPNVDQYGRWVTDPTSTRAGPGGENGIAALADYVHSLGLKFGIYVTPGISDQAVAQNTPIEGTSVHRRLDRHRRAAAQLQLRRDDRHQLQRPGAQAFTNSIVDELASLGRGLHQARRDHRPQHRRHQGMVGRDPAVRAPDAARHHRGQLHAKLGPIARPVRHPVGVLVRHRGLRHARSSPTTRRCRSGSTTLKLLGADVTADLSTTATTTSTPSRSATAAGRCRHPRAFGQRLVHRRRRARPSRSARPCSACGRWRPRRSSSAPT